MDQPGFWDRVLELDDAELWGLHLEMKRGLLTYIREEARRRWAERWKEAAHVVGAGTLINPDPLIIGFARRFATYKRANLLFHDFDRLHEMLVNPWRPVQTHLRRKGASRRRSGKEVLQRVYAMTRDPRLEGRVAFIEDYEMHLAHRLVQGVDLWLNVPAAAAGSVRHQRHEGGAQRGPPTQHTRRMVVRGVYGSERLGASRRRCRPR